MEYIEKSYLDVESIDEDGILFADGTKILFVNCIGNRYQSETCIAERGICAVPPYFEFFTSGTSTRILFDKKGLFSASVNRKNFLELQMKIDELGYSSYDLS